PAGRSRAGRLRGAFTVAQHPALLRCARAKCYARRCTMCDNDSLDDMMRYQLRAGELSRRQFGALTLGAGLVSMLPVTAAAVEVAEADVEVKTPDGTADAYFVHPATGRHPAILMWPDIYS